MFSTRSFLKYPFVIRGLLKQSLKKKTPGQLAFVFFTMLIAGAIVCQQFLLLIWGKRELRTEHYLIVSSASEGHTRELGQIAEVLYRANARLLNHSRNALPPQQLLRLNLFGSRTEFRVLNWPVGWAEALYRYPISHAYYEDSPYWYHWMLHEATHQLNREVAQLSLPLWAEEGLAAYFSTSTLSAANELQLGRLNYQTYPLWWGSSFGFSGNLEIDKKHNRVIGLSDLLLIDSASSMGSRFNLVYFEWLSFVHFLLHYDSGRYQSVLGCLVNSPKANLLPSYQKSAYWDNLEVSWYPYMWEIARGEAAFEPLSLTSLTCPASNMFPLPIDPVAEKVPPEYFGKPPLEQP